MQAVQVPFSKGRSLTYTGYEPNIIMMPLSGRSSTW